MLNILDEQMIDLQDKKTTTCLNQTNALEKTLTKYLPFVNRFYGYFMDKVLN